MALTDTFTKQVKWGGKPSGDKHADGGGMHLFGEGQREPLGARITAFFVKNLLLAEGPHHLRLAQRTVVLCGAFQTTRWSFFLKGSLQRYAARSSPNGLDFDPN